MAGEYICLHLATYIHLYECSVFEIHMHRERAVGVQIYRNVVYYMVVSLLTFITQIFGSPFHWCRQIFTGDYSHSQQLSIPSFVVKHCLRSHFIVCNMVTRHHIFLFPLKNIIRKGELITLSKHSSLQDVWHDPYEAAKIDQALVCQKLVVQQSSKYVAGNLLKRLEIAFS